MTELEKYYNDLLIIFGYLPTFFLLIPIGFAIKKWKNLNVPLRYIFWHCFWLFFFNVLVLIVIWTTNRHYDFWKEYLVNWGIKNTFFSRIAFFLNDFINLGACYLLLLLPNQSKLFRYGFVALLCMVSMVVFWFVDGYQNYGAVGQQMRHIVIIPLLLLQMGQLFRTNIKYSIIKLSFFWVNMGLIVPLLIGLIFEFSAENLYLQNRILYYQLHIGTNIVAIIGQAFIAVGFWQVKYLRLKK